MTVRDNDRGYRGFFSRLKRLITGQPAAEAAPPTAGTFVPLAPGAKGPRVVVGIRQEAGAQVVDGEFTLAEIAAVNEYGSEDGHIPERSFLRSTYDEGRERYAGLAQQAVTDHVDGRRDIRQGLERLGMVGVADVQERIRRGIPPANAPSTIARKGSDKPLIDTGRLRQSIDYVVEGA